MSISSLYPSISPSLILDFANSKVLDSRVTFTRTTTATYYDGVTTAKAEENLLTYSQGFDNAAWAASSITVSANAATAPDGTTTADQITFTGSTDYLFQSVNVIAGLQYTFSFYAKAGTATGAQYRVYNNTAGSDIVAPTSYYSSINSSTWSRISVTFTVPTGCSQIYVYSSRSSATSGTMFLWGAQLEQRSSATAYTATTTQAITNYIPVLQTAAAGQARFDHNPTTGESLGLLIEEARTNSLTYSSDFSNAAWLKLGNTITSNTIIAPDGTLTGDKVVPASSQTYNHNYQTKTLSTGTNYAISCYAKKGEYSYLNLGFIYDTGNYAGAQFDLNAGSVLYTRAAGSGFSVVSTSITPVGNGWYFCTVVATTGIATSFIQVVASNSTWTSGSLDVAIAGNGFSGIYIWGAQIEAGSFATSYIPTVASSVTRNADAASMTGTNFSSWFSNGEGTVYTEFAKFGVKAYGYLYSISNGATNEEISLNFDSAGTILYARIYSGGGYQMQATLTSSVTDNVFYRNSFGFEVNNSAASWNAGAVVTDSVCTIPNCNAFVLAASAVGSDIQSCRIKKFAFYPQRVSNTNLVAITT